MAIRMQRMAAQDEHPSIKDACIDCFNRDLCALGKVAFTGFSLAEDLAAGTGSQTRMDQNPESPCRLDMVSVWHYLRPV